MNEYTQLVVDYLLDGSSERKNALKDLIDRGILGSNPWADQTKVSINSYLEENPLGLCAEGIQRFRDATDTPAPTVRKIKFTVEAEVHETWQSDGFGNDSMVGHAIIGAITNVNFAWDDPQWSFKSARILENHTQVYRTNG